MEEELNDGVKANGAPQSSPEMENNEVEQSKVGIMRAVVEAQDPSAKVCFLPCFRP